MAKLDAKTRKRVQIARNQVHAVKIELARTRRELRVTKDELDRLKNPPKLTKP